MKNLTLPALIWATAVLIDFATVRHRPIIFERFYQWWLRLSLLNLNTAGNRGVTWFNNVIDRAFGPRVFSIRSLLLGTLFVSGATFAATLLPSFLAGSTANVGSTVLMSTPAVVPGLVNFFGARLLIHLLDRRIGFGRVLLFGFANLILIEGTAMLSYALLGFLTAFAVKLSFDHHLMLVDAVPVIGLLLLLALGWVFAYLPVAILPVVCCTFAWVVFILLYASSRIGLWIRDFLAERIEQKWDAPFTVIGGVIAAFVTVVLAFTHFVSPSKIVSTAISTQSAVNASSSFRATAFGTHTILSLSETKPELAKYYQDWGIGLQTFISKGIPTPAEFSAALQLHLPNLARQWNGLSNTENNSPRPH